jgi:predicted ABC-type ATPase
MITVIAGVNGAGKSSIAGAAIRQAGGDYFNPDEVSKALKSTSPSLSNVEANGEAWQLGYDQLSRAIEEKKDYTFETTLGGHSICKLLHKAIDQGIEVRIFFCGLDSPELHIQRVSERVAKGGHPIPEEKIRERWTHSIHNMLGLIKRCHSVKVFDNSKPADLHGPHPRCLFYLNQGQFAIPPVPDMPEWAKPLAAAAIKRILGSD